MSNFIEFNANSGINVIKFRIAINKQGYNNQEKANIFHPKTTSDDEHISVEFYE